MNHHAQRVTDPVQGAGMIEMPLIKNQVVEKQAVMHAANISIGLVIMNASRDLL